MYNKKRKLLCRLCLLDLEENEGTDLFSLINLEILNDKDDNFFNVDRKDKISDFLMEFSSVKVDVVNDVADLICNLCNLKITEFYAFKIKCEANDFKYKQFQLSGNDDDDFYNNVDFNLNNESDLNQTSDQKLIRKRKKKKTKLRKASKVGGEKEWCSKNEVKPKRIRGKKSTNDCSICDLKFENDDQCDKHFDEHLEILKEFTKFSVTKDDIFNFYTFCIQCLEKFNTYIELKDHLESGHINPNLKCRYCDITYKTTLDFEKHLKENHELVKLNCLKCLRAFGNIVEYKKHLDRKQKPCQIKQVFKCLKCLKNYCTYTELIDHIYVHLQDVLFKCNACTIEFISEKEFSEHNVKYHDRCQNQMEIKFCEYCGKSNFASDKFRYEHIKRHQDANKFIECKMCNKICKLNSYRMHVLQTHKRKKFTCCQCCKVLHTSNSLAKHLKLYHKIESDFKCPYVNCDQSFQTARGLKVHELNHTGENFIKEIAKYNSNKEKELKTKMMERKEEEKIVGFDNDKVSFECLEKQSSGNEIFSTVTNSFDDGQKTTTVVDVVNKNLSVLLNEMVDNQTSLTSSGSIVQHNSIENDSFTNMMIVDDNYGLNSKIGVQQNEMMIKNDIFANFITLQSNSVDIEEETPKSDVEDDVEHKRKERIKKNYIYRCDLCRNVRFETKEQFRLHNLAHVRFLKEITKFYVTIEDIFNNYTMCMICLERFNNYKDFKEHMHKGHVNRYLRCISCYTEYETIKEFEKHLEEKHEFYKQSCLKCLKSYKSTKLFEKHLEQNRKPKGLNKNILNCMICTNTSMTYSQLIQHFYTHFDLVFYRCHNCSMDFECQKDLDDHNFHVHQISKVVELVLDACPYCPRKYFKDKNARSSHLLNHKYSKKFVHCQICNKKIRKNIITSHSRIHRELTHKCHLCDRKFLNSNSLCDHLRKSHGVTDLQFKCTFCEKSFLSKKGRDYHEKYHSDERGIRWPKRLFPCSKCGFSNFKSKQDKQKHMRLHEENITVLCPHCNKLFKKNSMRSHIYQYHSTTQFNCQSCHLTFKRADQLRYHSRAVHMVQQDTPFKCTFEKCTKSYITEHGLKIHTSRHHSNQTNLGISISS